MPELRGSVVNNQGTPLAGAVVTLIGAGAPQAQPTDALGQFCFPDLPAGVFRLSAVLEGYFPSLLPAITVNAEQPTESRISLGVSADAQSLYQKIIAGIPLVTMGLMSLIFAIYLFKGLVGTEGFGIVELGKDDVARGVITYLVALGTIAIGIILVVSTILGSGDDLGNRFARGKEIFTLLIGVLGTVMGFYYGKTATNTNPNSPSVIQVAPITFSEQPKPGAAVNLITKITGGSPPYTYSIKFGSSGIAEIPEKTSANGDINEKITIPAQPASWEGEIEIKVKDQDGKGKETISKQKLTWKAPPSQ